MTGPGAAQVVVGSVNDRAMRVLLCICLPVLLSGSATFAVGPVKPAESVPSGPSLWGTRLSAGYDAYVHSYYLATTDTTETVTEFNTTAEIEGRSRRGSSHQWLLRGEMSAGTELMRETLASRYRWRPAAGPPRLGADLAWQGRQYREGSDYSLSSDNHEGRAEVRAAPWADAGKMLDLRVSGRYLSYARPSTLQQDLRAAGIGAFIASHGSFTDSWRVGLGGGRRVYPDSAAIDRDLLSGEGRYDHQGERLDLWVFHRSERRRINDETVRPSAWSHWTELRLAVRAGAGRVLLDLTSTLWRYDTETGVYFDSHLADAACGYRWGRIPDPSWRLLVTGQRLEAGDSPESYSQVGLRGGYESYLGSFSGSVALEYGRRWYDVPGGSEDPLETLDLDTLLPGYTDFSYLETWFMATWRLRVGLDLEMVVSYQPESHTEQDDDMAIGYGNLRLVWRP